MSEPPAHGSEAADLREEIMKLYDIPEDLRASWRELWHAQHPDDPDDPDRKADEA